MAIKRYWKANDKYVKGYNWANLIIMYYTLMLAGYTDELYFRVDTINDILWTDLNVSRGLQRANIRGKWRWRQWLHVSEP